MPNICDNCQHWKPGPADFGHCGVHEITTYWGHTCAQHSDKAAPAPKLTITLPEPQQQSACRPVMLTNPLACPACRSLFVCAGLCQQCGARAWP